MGLTNLPKAGRESLVKPINPPTPVGVKEDGYKKQLAQDTKKRPMAPKSYSPETDNPNGTSFGTRV